MCASVAVSSEASSSWPALAVTVCSSFQSAGLNVSESLSSVRSVSAWPEIDTVTFAAGCVARRTEYSALPPSATPSVVADSTSAGSSSSVTVTATSAAAAS